MANRLFTLQPEEEIYFKHSATHEKTGPSGLLYVTSLRFAWISHDKAHHDVILPWAEIKNDQYKTGKSKYCAVRITSIGSSGPNEDHIDEFYLGETNSELLIEIENCRAAIKRARQAYLQANPFSIFTLASPSPPPSAPAKSGPITATIASSSGGSKTQQVLQKSFQHHSEEKRRLDLLNSDRNLRKEYEELVGSVNNPNANGALLLTPDEFWSTRQHLLLQQECIDLKNHKGMASSLLIEKADLKNKKKIQINAEIIQEIFTLNPIVRKVYEEKVPHELTEDEFWTQYFLSEYFTRDKAHLQSETSRKGASHATTDDMFSRAEENEKLQKKLAEKLSQKQTHGGSCLPSSLVATQQGVVDHAPTLMADTSLEKNISSSVAVDTDLTSTFGDYHPPERFEPNDSETSHRSAVIDKYIRKSTAVVDSQYREKGNDAGNGLSGHKRRYGDWSWSGTEYFPELQPPQAPDYLPLHLHPTKKPDVDESDTSTPHHSHHHHHTHHHHHHSHTDARPRSIEINHREISISLSHVFPSNTVASEFLRSDLRLLSSQSESKNSQFTSQSSSNPSVISLVDGKPPPSLRSEAIGIPQDIQQVVTPFPCLTSSM